VLRPFVGGLAPILVQSGDLPSSSFFLPSGPEKLRNRGPYAILVGIDWH
jgi:hypothetical protein